MSEDRSSYLSVVKSVRIRDKGQITIPSEIRERLDMELGTVMDVRQVGEAIVIYPRQSKVDELVKSVQQSMAEHGVDLEQLLAELREGNHEYEAD
jgi:AbrB family looped-hinge helix DNA binding protein